MSLIHALTRGSLFEYVPFHGSFVIKNVAGSHKSAWSLALQVGVGPLLRWREGGFMFRVYSSCGRRTSACIHLGGMELQPIAIKRSAG